MLKTNLETDDEWKVGFLDAGRLREDDSTKR
jgi:hypothetical protein